jgi:hypothetical protein
MMVSYAMEPQTRIDVPWTPVVESRDYTGEEALTFVDARPDSPDGGR